MRSAAIGVGVLECMQMGRRQPRAVPPAPVAQSRRPARLCIQISASRRCGRTLSRPRNSKHDDDGRRDDGVNTVGADRDVVALNRQVAKATPAPRRNAPRLIESFADQGPVSASPLVKSSFSAESTVGRNIEAGQQASL